MKILIPGGAGYLGSELVFRLLALGHRVTVLDSFRHGVPSLAVVGAHSNLNVIVADVVTDPGLLHRVAAKAKAVVHLAALVGAPACDAEPERAVLLNQIATEDLAARLRPEQILIYPCTNSGYGRGGEAPATESDPMAPISLYGRTKVAGEAAVLRHPLGVSLRLATLYGPSARMRLDLLVNDLVHRAVRHGRLEVYEASFRRCVLSVFDACSAIIWALARAEELAGRPWNVGAESVTKRQLCELIARHLLGFSWTEAEGRDQDQRDYAVSSEAFRSATGWKPSVSLEGGIAQLVRLYRMPFDGPAWRNA